MKVKKLVWPFRDLGTVIIIVMIVLRDMWQVARRKVLIVTLAFDTCVANISTRFSYWRRFDSLLVHVSAGIFENPILSHKSLGFTNSSSNMILAHHLLFPLNVYSFVSCLSRFLTIACIRHSNVGFRINPSQAIRGSFTHYIFLIHHPSLQAFAQASFSTN